MSTRGTDLVVRGMMSECGHLPRQRSHSCCIARDVSSARLVVHPALVTTRHGARIGHELELHRPDDRLAERRRGRPRGYVVVRQWGAARRRCRSSGGHGAGTWPVVQAARSASLLIASHELDDPVPVVLGTIPSTAWSSSDRLAGSARHFGKVDEASEWMGARDHPAGLDPAQTRGGLGASERAWAA